MPPNRHYITCLSILLCFVLAGCSRYTIKLNEREIYVPAEPQEAPEISDQALKDCVEQTMLDQKITNSKELELLNCSYAGIASLEGLSSYSRLTHLSLKQNQISDTGELTKLVHLKTLDISDNPALTCTQVEQLIIAGIERVDSNLSCNK